MLKHQIKCKSIHKHSFNLSLHEHDQLQPLLTFYPTIKTSKITLISIKTTWQPPKTTRIRIKTKIQLKSIRTRLAFTHFDSWKSGISGDWCLSECGLWLGWLLVVVCGWTSVAKVSYWFWQPWTTAAANMAYRGRERRRRLIFVGFT